MSMCDDAVALVLRDVMRTAVWRELGFQQQAGGDMNEPLFDPSGLSPSRPASPMSAPAARPRCLRRHDAVLSRYLHDKSSGMAGRVAQEAEIARARAGIARLWGVDVGDIGFVSNVAEGVSIVAESLDWRDGDNIVIDANEYPSVAGPFLLHRRPAWRCGRRAAPSRIVSPRASMSARG